jgi:exonuclease V gamma subunit
MLNLHFAPSADLLVPILLARLRAAWRDPLLPPTVIVPSPAVGKWLHLRLADCPVPDAVGNPLALGCTANLVMQTLERILWEVLQPAGEMRLLDAAVMQQVICARLTSSLLHEDAYAPVRAYLLKPDGAIDPIKKVQLAAKIARQFQEYEFNRPSVWDAGACRWVRKGADACWMEKKRYDAFRSMLDKTDIDESWQMDLYNRVQESLLRGAADPEANKVRWISLPHLHRLRRGKGLDDGCAWTVPPGEIFLFQVSKISHFHRNTLVEISQMPGVAMHLYLTNPCAEFWEDVDTRRNRDRLRRAWKHDSAREQAGITARRPDDYEKEELAQIEQLPRDHTLLELWGNAGKANIFLWCAHAQWNFEYHSPAWVESDTRPDTLLKALQYSLLRGQNELPEGGWRSDGSLRVLAGPDPGREVEELRERILDLVAKNEIRRLNEIVVYLPDPATYLPQIHRVFGALRPGDPGCIPYTVLGAPGSDSVFSQGVHTLVAIIEGHFDRVRVFALLRNPIVQATHAIAPENVTIWEGWAEALGIFRGFNREHRRLMGDLGQTLTDAHTFELGMARLLIGNLADSPVELPYQLLEETPITAIPAYRDFDTSDAENVEAFCALIERLHRETQQVRDTLEKESLSAAADALSELVWSWFGTIPDDMGAGLAAEGRVRAGFRDALLIVKQQEVLAKRADPVGLPEFLALVKECLPQELPAGSKAWTGGITFAPLRPAMIVPHRVIFALGLDAAAFPGSSDKSTWNLLSHKRIVGDSDQVRDNRFAFLELLHAARDCLILSFRGRNMQKEEELQPASLILELESYLKSQGLKGDGPESQGERCLIRRDIPWIVRESMAEMVRTGRGHGTWDPVEARLARILQEHGDTKALSRYGPRVAVPVDSPAGPLRTSMYNLRTFFANPLEYHLLKTLGIELDEPPGTMSATDEPLQSGALEVSGLHKSIWTCVLGMVFPADPKDACADPGALGDAAEAIALKVHRAYLATGRAPEAQLCGIERQHLVGWARECVAATLELRGAFADHALLQNADMSLGREGMPGELEVDMGNNRLCVVECRHGLVLVPRSWEKKVYTKNDAVGLATICKPYTKKNKAADNPDLWLPGVIQWLTENQMESLIAPSIILVQLDRKSGGANLSSFTQAAENERREKVPEIHRWLQRLLREMLCDQCADHLPFKVIQGLFGGAWEELTRARVEDEISDAEHGYRTFLEAFKLVDARIPEGDIGALAKVRFAPLLERWIHE